MRDDTGMRGAGDADAGAVPAPADADMPGQRRRAAGDAAAAPDLVRRSRTGIPLFVPALLDSCPREQTRQTRFRIGVGFILTCGQISTGMPITNEGPLPRTRSSVLFSQHAKDAGVLMKRHSASRRLSTCSCTHDPRRAEQNLSVLHASGVLISQLPIGSCNKCPSSSALASCYGVSTHANRYCAALSSMPLARERMYRCSGHCGPRPDHGLPPDSAALRRILSLMRAAREAGASVPYGGGPPIIHDSAGARAIRLKADRVTLPLFVIAPPGLAVACPLPGLSPAEARLLSSPLLQLRSHICMPWKCVTVGDFCSESAALCSSSALIYACLGSASQ